VHNYDDEEEDGADEFEETDHDLVELNVKVKGQTLLLFFPHSTSNSHASLKLTPDMKSAYAKTLYKSPHAKHDANYFPHTAGGGHLGLMRIPMVATWATKLKLIYTPLGTQIKKKTSGARKLQVTVLQYRATNWTNGHNYGYGL
jgi:hypothetical protein